MSAQVQKTRKCIKCRVPLLVDVPKTITTTNCTFCNTPNPNPALLIDDKTAAYNKYGGSTQTIYLKESTFSHFITMSSLALVTIFAYLTIAGTRFPFYYSFIAVLIAHFPLISKSFVPAHWEKICKWATSETGDRYKVEYTRPESDWINHVATYILIAWFFIRLLIWGPYIESDNSLTYLMVIISLFLGYGGYYLVDLAISLLGRWLGVLIPRLK